MVDETKNLKENPHEKPVEKHEPHQNKVDNIAVDGANSSVKVEEKHVEAKTIPGTNSSVKVEEKHAEAKNIPIQNTIQTTIKEEAKPQETGSNKNVVPTKQNQEQVAMSRESNEQQPNEQKDKKLAAETPKSAETPKKEEIVQKKEVLPENGTKKGVMLLENETLPQQLPQSENNKDSITREKEVAPCKPESPQVKSQEKPHQTNHIKSTETKTNDTKTPETKMTATPIRESDSIVKRIDINKAENDGNLSQKIKENDLKSQNDAIKNGSKRQGACTKCIII